MKKLFYLILALGVCWSSVGFGDTLSEDFEVTLDVQGTCEITTLPGTIYFGTYDGSTTLEANTTFSVNCSQGIEYYPYLSTSSFIDFNLSGLTVSLYKPDSTTSTSCTSLTDLFPETFADPSYYETGDGTNQDWAICGEISSGQSSSAPGSYFETVTLYVDFNPTGP